MVSNIFYVHPYLGKIPILTTIFQMGWNHQQGQKEFPFLKRQHLTRQMCLEPPSSPSSEQQPRQVAAETAVEIDQEYTSISDQVQVNDWVVVSNIVYFSCISREMAQFDEHTFPKGLVQPPTRWPGRKTVSFPRFLHVFSGLERGKPDFPQKNGLNILHWCNFLQLLPRWK